MKKLLSLLMAAMLLPLTMGALDLGPNQMLMGHYLTDDLATSGWGSTSLEGISTVATDITADELSAFGAGEIVAFRVGLFLATPISRVFVIPVTPDGNLMMDDMTEWPCSASSQGWNMIELDTPYKLSNLPGGYSLRIGFDYEQETKFSKPLSVVKKGTIYPTYHIIDGDWKQLIISSRGNLSLQCVVENESFPQYVIRVRNIQHDKMIKLGNELNVTFETYKLSQANVDAGSCSYEIAIDGVVVNTLTNPVALTADPITLSCTLNTDGLAAGDHTLSISPVAVNGEPLPDPVVFPSTFSVFENGFERQMHLVEQFTSTNCTYCPQGTANIVNLTEMRDDIAWVAHHEYMSGADPFMTQQTDSLDNLQGIDGYPEGTFDRTTGIQGASYVYAVLTNLSASTMNTFLDYVDSQGPSWATVYINSTFDAATRKAVVTINGDLAPGFEDFMGEDAKLSVYLTEDGLVAAQVSGGNNYVHNNVMRLALGSIMGVQINKTSDITYNNTFTVDIPAGWNADNMHIVAFISRPLGNPLNDIYVTNCNKRKFGEFDEPTYLRGDVDCDGKVNIADVTALIEYLLSHDASIVDLQAADCDESSVINIDDVTTLIDYLLKHSW